MKDQIAAYTAQSFKPVKIAEILGCSEAYVSEVQADEHFPELVAVEAAKIKKSKDEEKQDEQYIKLEATLLTQIEDSIPFAEFSDLTRLMETLIKRKQNRFTVVPPTGSLSITQNNYIKLEVPSIVAPEIVLNSNKEVVAIGDKTLAPMPSSQVRSLFDAVKNKREQLKQVQADIEDVKELEVIPDDF